ncbi:MAG: hypothetical protein A2097_09410 [Desulfobacula sp. GWF2_41_7]|nr:MAG: hypothetical protein A2097_09410 [Desulfobacula sp. GWF2_41_7]
MKLLSIDGGGIKGLYSAIVLDYIENYYDIKIIDHVDVISGTSIGGIIAIALAAGNSPRSIINFLLNYGPLIFPSKGIGGFARLTKSLFFSKYNSTILKKACIDFFSEDACLNDLFNKEYPDRRRSMKLSICIPSVNISTGKVKVFKTPHSDELFLDKGYKLWQVALATSAAPYYLPIAKISKENIDEKYIDGGLWGNNPSLVAFTEALTYSNKSESPIPDESMDLLSIGNIPENLGITRNILNRGLLLWNIKLVLLPLSCQAESIHNMIKLLFTKNQWNYIRIEHANSNIPGVKLDSTKRKNMDLIQQLALSDISNYVSANTAGDKKIRQFFNLEGK